MLMLLAMLVACNGNDGNDPDTDTSDVGTDSESSASADLDTYDWSGNVTLVNRVEDPAQADYTLSTEALVEGTLTIEAGVRIDIAATGTFLVSGGTFNSNGTEAAPVILDGGFGVILRTGTHTLTHTQIVNAGQGTELLQQNAAALTLGLDNLQATATLDHVSLIDSEAVGLWADTGSSFTATALTISGTGEEYAVVTDYAQLGMFGSDLSLAEGTNPTVRSRAYTELEADSTFDFPHAPVVLEDDLVITDTGSLTIAAGTELRFPAASGLYANGTLIANGTAEAPVLLTGAAGTAGSWIGVQILNASNNSLTHTTIQYGGADLFGYEDGNLIMGGDLAPSAITLTNVHIADSAAWGIVAINMVVNDLDLSTVTFSNNASGNAMD